ncbi:MAG: formylmethanofuran dehydrogenase subunit B [Ignisphaera sp.]
MSSSVKGISVMLNTGRSLRQGISMESDGKWSATYYNDVAFIELNPDDAKLLGNPERVKVTTSQSSIVLPVRISDRTRRGTAFIPMGPWANMLVDPDTDGTGIPYFKATRAYIEPSMDSITTLQDILKILNAKVFETPMTDLATKLGEKYIVENVTCPFCGDLCDFLKIEVEGTKIVRNIGGCAISIAKFLNYYKHRVLKPYVRDGRRLVEVNLEKAIEKAAEVLVNAKYPLIYGLSSTCVEAIEVAVELAEILHGVIDNTTVVCHGPTTLAVQEVGTVTATFAPMLHLADLVVFWGCNPREAHMNHMSRLVMSKGKFVEGRRGRRVIVVDVRKTLTTDTADMYIQVEPGRDLEVLTALRMAIKELEIESPTVAGLPREKILELAEMMRSARYGVIFFGMGLTQSEARFRAIEEAIRLVQDLNEWTKFILLPMRGHYNVNGANQALLWSTGYPYAVDFSRGFPRMFVGVTTSPDLLANGDVDAALIIASDPVAHFPRKAVEYLAKIPVIVVDPKWSLTTAFADIVIPAGLVGIECEGTAYRMDGVPIYMKKVVEPPPGVFCDKEVLEMLLVKVKELKKVGV